MEAMTNDLVKRLREWWNYDNGRLFENAITHIEALTAGREALEQDNHRWKMECENFWRDREKTLTAECDRLRKELENIADDCEAEYPPSHGAIKYAVRMALKGE